MQVRVKPVIVPAERVAVRREPVVQLGSNEKQKFPRCCPLPGGQIEHRSPVNFRDEGAGAWHDVERITRVSGRGVDAELVLEVQVRIAQPVVIAKDTTFGHRTVLLADRELSHPPGPDRPRPSVPTLVALVDATGSELIIGLRRQPRRMGRPGPADNDVDLLVDLPPGLSLFGLGRVQAELEAILGTRGDLVPAQDLKPGVRERVEHELVAL
jgi:hypothetical protein